MIAAVAAIIISLRRAASDIKKNKADIHKAQTEAAGEVTDSTIALLKPLNDRIRELGDEINDLRQERTKMNQEIRQRDAKIKSLGKIVASQADRLTEFQLRLDKITDWARRLTAQIDGLGEIPVPFEVKIDSGG